ncbi:transcriptional regulator [Enterobacter kobei]|uniref:transcriptional regulator n=1 Tax=Enterobacter kobei TaxID=208224 RepID=UPI002378655B|nr:transcriptional regulator [Enterobacter kobei]MDD9232934.1 transcriptional regulator [Enterobacter kobei]
MINKKSSASTPLEKAINAVGGSQKVLAEKVGVTPQAINMLKKRGGSLPVCRFTRSLTLPLCRWHS